MICRSKGILFPAVRWWCTLQFFKKFSISNVFSNKKKKNEKVYSRSVTAIQRTHSIKCTFYTLYCYCTKVYICYACAHYDKSVSGLRCWYTYNKWQKKVYQIDIVMEYCTLTAIVYMGPWQVLIGYTYLLQFSILSRTFSRLDVITGTSLNKTKLVSNLYYFFESFYDFNE